MKTPREIKYMQSHDANYHSSLHTMQYVLLTGLILFVMSAGMGSTALAQMHQGHDHTMIQQGQSADMVMTYDAPKEFKTQLGDVYQAYFHIQFALSHDNAAEAKKGAEHLAHALSGVDMTLLKGDAHMAWMKELNTIKTNGAGIAGAKDIDAARLAFKPVSQSLITVSKMFGISGKKSVYQFHCPMADNNTGADWLQNKKDLENPYFGSSMSKCGSIVETYEAATE